MGVRPIGVEEPGVLVVFEEDRDNLSETIAGLGIEDRARCLDPARKVPVHPVGGVDIELVVAQGAFALGEGVDPGVFEESPDDGADLDVLAHAFDPWSEAAETSHDKVNLDTGVGGVVEGFGDLPIFHRVHLGEDMGGFACFGVLYFAVDEFFETMAHVIWRDEEPVVGLPGAEPGDHIEEPNDIGGDVFVGGEQAQIGISLGGFGVIVAGAEVSV